MRWMVPLKSPERLWRVLALVRLGEIAGSDSARALKSYFGRVTPDEGVEILRALGGVPEPESRELIERILVTEEFDSADRRELREMAAWAAWQIGGRDMMDALRISIDRREGRDARILVYYGLLAGKKALPTFERYGISRMRIYNSNRTLERERMDELTRRIASGRSTATWEVTPDKLQFGPVR